MKEFWEYLYPRVNRDIYINGAQGHQASDEYIRKHEGSENNHYNRTVKLLKKRLKAGIKQEDIHAFDCSGLGCKFFLEKKLIKRDSTASTLFHGYCKEITKEDLLAGDMVFRRHKGRVHHVGYVTPYGVIESAGHDSGVIVGHKWYWNVYGRPKFWKDDIEAYNCKPQYTYTSIPGYTPATSSSSDSSTDSSSTDDSKDYSWCNSNVSNLQVKQIAHMISGAEGKEGSCRWDDGNCLSVGMLQWHGNRGRDLIKEIEEEDSSQTQVLDNGGVRSRSESWSDYIPPAGSQRDAIESVMKSDASKKVQHRKIIKDTIKYLKKIDAWGMDKLTVGTKALIADLYNNEGHNGPTVKWCRKNFKDVTITFDEAWPKMDEVRRAARDGNKRVYGQHKKAKAIEDGTYKHKIDYEDNDSDTEDTSDSSDSLREYDDQYIVSATKIMSKIVYDENMDEKTARGTDRWMTKYIAEAVDKMNDAQRATSYTIRSDNTNQSSTDPTLIPGTNLKYNPSATGGIWSLPINKAYCVSLTQLDAAEDAMADYWDDSTHQADMVELADTKFTFADKTQNKFRSDFAAYMTILRMQVITKGNVSTLRDASCKMTVMRGFTPKSSTGAEKGHMGGIAIDITVANQDDAVALANAAITAGFMGVTISSKNFVHIGLWGTGTITNE